MTDAPEFVREIRTEFLDFARPQTPNLQKCDLKQIIEKNLTFLEPELQKRGITVRNILDGRPLALLADQELLYRAFLNIFINSHPIHRGGRENRNPRES